MEITVTGKSNAWTDAGGASSSFLVSENDFRLLVDCGTGVFAKLRTVCRYTDIDAILVSHLHADHILDLIPYSFALCYSTEKTGHRPRLLGPPGFSELCNGLGRVFGFGDQLHRAFDIHEYREEDELDIGPLHARFCEVPHFVPAYASELTTQAGARLTYGSDCGYNVPLVEFAMDTDLLILEATLGGDRAPSPDDLSGHMTARQAGELARTARAQRLVLTHFSDEIDASAIEREGTVGFGAPVQLAHEQARFTV